MLFRKALGYFVQIAPKLTQHDVVNYYSIRYLYMKYCNFRYYFRVNFTELLKTYQLCTTCNDIEYVSKYVCVSLCRFKYSVCFWKYFLIIIVIVCFADLRPGMQPQPVEYLPADRSPDPGPYRDREPDSHHGNDYHNHWDRKTCLYISIPAVVGCSERCGPHYIYLVHPVFQVTLCKALWVLC